MDVAARAHSPALPTTVYRAATCYRLTACCAPVARYLLPLLPTTCRPAVSAYRLLLLPCLPPTLPAASLPALTPTTPPPCRCCHFHAKFPACHLALGSAVGGRKSGETGGSIGGVSVGNGGRRKRRHEISMAAGGRRAAGGRQRAGRRA